jgi:hypothetical protein
MEQGLKKIRKPVQVIDFVDPNPNRKRSRTQDEGSGESKTSSKDSQQRAYLPLPALKRESEEQVRRSVAKLGESGLELRDKKARDAALLRKLGAIVPKHSHKMPLKMAIGVIRKKKENEEKRLAALKDGGMLAGGGGGKNAGGGGESLSAKKRRKEDEKKERRRSERENDITPIDIRGSVMFVGKR